MYSKYIHYKIIYILIYFTFNIKVSKGKKGIIKGNLEIVRVI